MNVFHVLNGDALKSQIPRNSVEGELIVMRECLVDGNVSGETLEDLISTRIKSMHEMFGASELDYLQKAAPELHKINQINEGEVNLWFEDDLFCQVNLWFVCHLLSGKSISAYLVRPNGSLRFGFGGVSPDDLPKLLDDRILLSDIQVTQFAQLWKAYQREDLDELLGFSQKLTDEFPFLADAIQAQLNRRPTGDGLPERTLREIMTELNTQDFGTVFREFSRRLPIYGFGDLQVRRIFGRLIEN